MRHQKRKNTWQKLTVFCLTFCLLLICFLGCISGPVEITVEDIAKIVQQRLSLGDSELESDYQVKETILLSIRLPRIILGCIVGAALGIAGGIMQGLFRNPLAEPGLIGVSSGGALGAVFCIVLGNLFLDGVLSAFGFGWATALCAMISGLLITGLIYQLSKINGKPHVTTMLLTGIAINALVAAAIGVMIFVASDDELRSLTYWSLGSLSGATWEQNLILVALVLIPLAFVFKYSRALNAFLLGEAEAFHLGVDVPKVRRNLIVLTACMVGASVAMCGIIGFVGLVTPHCVRLFMGSDHRTLLPASALLGAFILVFADIVARSLAAPAELPIGIITAFLGAPFFLWLLWRSRNQKTLYI